VHQDFEETKYIFKAKKSGSFMSLKLLNSWKNLKHIKTQFGGMHHETKLNFLVLNRIYRIGTYYAFEKTTFNTVGR